jgi:hypothetical protein
MPAYSRCLVAALDPVASDLPRKRKADYSDNELAAIVTPSDPSDSSARPSKRQKEATTESDAAILAAIDEAYHEYLRPLTRRPAGTGRRRPTYSRTVRSRTFRYARKKRSSSSSDTTERDENSSSSSYVCHPMSVLVPPLTAFGAAAVLSAIVERRQHILDTKIMIDLSSQAGAFAPLSISRLHAARS